MVIQRRGAVVKGVINAVAVPLTSLLTYYYFGRIYSSYFYLGLVLTTTGAIGFGYF